MSATAVTSPYQTTCTQPVVNSDVVLLQNPSEEPHANDHDTYHGDGVADGNGLSGVDELVVGDGLHIVRSHCVRGVGRNPTELWNRSQGVAAILSNQTEVLEPDKRMLGDYCLCGSKMEEPR